MQDLRSVSKEDSEIIALSEMGMIPIAISMKLNIPFTHVMDVLKNVPPVKTPKKLESKDDTKVAGQNGERIDGKQDARS